MSIDESEDTSLFGKSTSTTGVDPDGVVGKAAASAHEKVDRAAASAQSAFDCAHDYLDKAVEAPRNVIRDNPVASVVLALAVGFLWGRLGASHD
ncbi:hypothetical protein [Xylophilus sp. GOD-11R]|uniref:hypothetical protein n=1 Tax=Xylophilus sp. GOD-11R TaxID=3089814 RepID=UPI00298D4206|nr:hypothetical protein [Xylophilus sp. GOD-11R]WPB58211.1 hypothetical protein R9X41_06105 [Xylophilus sp. GOD-11R]